MKTLKRSLWVLLGIVGIALLIYVINRSVKTEQPSVIETNHTVLEKKNEVLDSKILKLQEQAEQRYIQIQHHHHLILQLKHKHYENLRLMDSMSTRDLYLYFSEFKTDSTAY